MLKTISFHQFIDDFFNVNPCDEEIKVQFNVENESMQCPNKYKI